MSKVFIATPTPYAMVQHDYARSLFRTAEVLPKHGIETDLMFLAECAYVDMGRDMLINAFLESDATHLLNIDFDLGWDAEAIVRMVKHDVDFVAGVYPVKQDEPKFHATFNGEQRNGLLGVISVTGGFTMIKREAIEKMIAHYPELRGKGIDLKETTFLHLHEVHDGRVWGEDLVFCRRAREVGIEMWVDPTLNFRHWNGTKCYDHTLIGNVIKLKASTCCQNNA